MKRAEKLGKSGLIANPQILHFFDQIIVEKIDTFNVGDFFNQNGNSKITIEFNELAKIFFRSIESEDYSLEESKLNYHLFFKNDIKSTEVETDFIVSPVIPVNIFVPQIKTIIENHKKSSHVLGTILLVEKNQVMKNIFHVQLQDIVSFEVYQTDVNIFTINACQLSDELIYGDSNIFFSYPAN